MKRILITFLFFLITSIGYSQNNKLNNNNIDTTILSIVDELPYFSRGDTSLVEYISKNFIYPATLKRNGMVAGSNTICFIVTEEGKITNVKVTGKNTKMPDLDNELIRVFETMPDWTPGINKGKKVKVIYLLDVYIHDNYIIRLYDLSIFNNKKAKANDAYNSGVKKSSEGDFYGAINDFTTALEFNPKDIDALYNRGIMRYKLKDTEGACDDWYSIKALGKKDADEFINKFCIKK